MTKKDVLEIRHLFAPKECSISKIRGCYVDGDCNKVATINEQFLTMPEEETYKYFEILKKTLSGSIGKNLVTIDRKSTRLNSSHPSRSRMPSSA